MKHLVVSATLIVALSGSVAFAQQSQAPAPDAQAPVRQHHAPSPERQTKHMSKRLGLTPDQAAKVEPILADRDQKMAALQGASLTLQQVHQQKHEIAKDTMVQLGSVLTPDQMQQFRAMRHGHKHSDGAGAPPQGNEAPAPAPQAS
jgi:protein CpxP